MEQNIDQRVDSLEKGLAALGQELKHIAEALSAGFTKVGNNFSAVQKDLATLHLKVDLLKAQTTGGLEDVGVKIVGLTEEITKINKVTQYEDIFRNTETINN